MTYDLNLTINPIFHGDVMPEEKLDPRLKELLDKDPVAFFHALAELYQQNMDPKAMGIIPSNPVTKKVKSPDRWAKQQIENAVSAAGDWLDGVKNPSRNPVEAALDKKDKWIDRLTQAIKDGKWEKNLKKVSHAEIVAVVEKLGSGVYSSGVSARDDKIKKRVGELQPLVQAVSDTIQAMPDKTDADREKRFLAARRLMIEVGKKRAGA
jgi:hypothetical protein